MFSLHYSILTDQPVGYTARETALELGLPSSTGKLFPLLLDTGTGIVKQDTPRASWPQAILKLCPSSSLDYKARHGPQTLFIFVNM